MVRYLNDSKKHFFFFCMRSISRIFPNRWNIHRIMCQKKKKKTTRGKKFPVNSVSNGSVHKCLLLSWECVCSATIRKNIRGVRSKIITFIYHSLFISINFTVNNWRHDELPAINRPDVRNHTARFAQDSYAKITSVAAARRRVICTSRRRYKRIHGRIADNTGFFFFFPILSKPSVLFRRKFCIDNIRSTIV